MSLFSKLLVSTSLILFASDLAHADLIVGWNSFNTNGSRLANQAPQDVANGFSGTLGTNVRSGAPNQGGGVNATTGGDFTGNTTYGTAYSIVNAGSPSGVILNSFSNNNRYIDFSVTNNSGGDLTLEGIHFDARMTFNNNSIEDREVKVSHFSSESDLGDAFANRNLGGTGVINAANFSYNNFDVNLGTSGLVDLVLSNTETAAFRIFIDDNTTSNNYGFAIDNIGISGSFASIPEPSSLCLFAAGILSVIPRRRRKSKSVRFKI